MHKQCDVRTCEPVVFAIKVFYLDQKFTNKSTVHIW